MRLSARRPSLLLVLLLLVVFCILVHRSRYLIALLLETGSKDALYPSTITSPFSELPQNTTYLIPKILHQTYKTKTDIPQHWLAGQQVVKGLHQDWEYMFWTDASALEFITTHYPAYLSLYTSYPHPIQRSDVLRYFLLHHYGGIYLDLDLTPYRPLTPLLSVPAFACLTSPTGISNDALGSAPGYPFFGLAIRELEAYKSRWWISDWVGGRGGYLGVMYSTGPLFLSVVWVKFLWMGGGGHERLRVLVQEDGVEEGYGFFRNQQGGSWHGKDAEAIFWIGRHWLLVTVVGILGGMTFVIAVFWGCKLLARWWEGRDRRSGYRYKEVV